MYDLRMTRPERKGKMKTNRWLPLAGGARLAGLAALLTFALLPLSCNAPDSIAKFSSSAVKTLKTGDAIFDDMRASCIREVQTREPFGSFALSDAPVPPECDDIGKQAEGLKAASGLLTKYFASLNGLASFGTAKTSEDVEGLLSKATAQSKLSETHQKALASIAGLLTRLLATGYQQKHLADDIVKVHEDVKMALNGFAEAVGVVYLRELQEEEHKTASRYSGFLVEHPQAPDAILVLDARWQTDRANFAAKETAVRNYQAALAALVKGNEDLAAHARSLKAKDMPALLSVYTAQLEAMVPLIQKGF
jgi:hypothetical protein